MEGLQCDKNKPSHPVAGNWERVGAGLISDARRTGTSRVRKRGPRATSADTSERKADAKRVVARALGDEFVSEYEKLQKDLRDLAEGIRMIRRATERACRGGVLPAVEEGALTPLQECAAIARAIYRAARTPDHQRPVGRKPNLAAQDR
ncbi:MAG: hypothetical protein K2Y71_11620 [Xanthobacteraceae bacterium]|nr:hypothetical protein [Xanthobacteraceae bacterium]